MRCMQQPLPRVLVSSKIQTVYRFAVGFCKGYGKVDIFFFKKSIFVVLYVDSKIVYSTFKLTSIYYCCGSCCTYTNGFLVNLC